MATSLVGIPSTKLSYRVLTLMHIINIFYTLQTYFKHNAENYFVLSTGIAQLQTGL